MNSKFKPGLLVGLAVGALLILTVAISSLPAIRGGPAGMIGCCNCLWPILGGLLATYMYIRASSVPATVSDGAVIGLIAGAVAGLINLVIGLPVQYFLAGVDALDAQIRQISPDFPLTGISLMVIGGIIGFFIMIALSVIGGLIAVPIFEKRKGGANLPPPPPNTAGGSAPGGYGSNI